MKGNQFRIKLGLDSLESLSYHKGGGDKKRRLKSVFEFYQSLLRFKFQLIYFNRRTPLKRNS